MYTEPLKHFRKYQNIFIFGLQINPNILLIKKNIYIFILFYICCLVAFNINMIKKTFFFLTVSAQNERSGRPLDTCLGDGVGHDAGVVAHVGRLDFSDVQIPRLLGHEPPGVLLHEGRVLVKNPRERQSCGHRTEKERKARQRNTRLERGHPAAQELHLHKHN